MLPAMTPSPQPMMFGPSVAATPTFPRPSLPVKNKKKIAKNFISTHSPGYPKKALHLGPVLPAHTPKNLALVAGGVMSFLLPVVCGGWWLR